MSKGVERVYLKRVFLMLLLSAAVLSLGACGASLGESVWTWDDSAFINVESHELNSCHELFYIGEGVEELILDASVHIEGWNAVSIEIINNSRGYRVEWGNYFERDTDFQIPLTNLTAGDVYSFAINARNMTGEPVSVRLRIRPNTRGNARLAHSDESGGWVVQRRAQIMQRS